MATSREGTRNAAPSKFFSTVEATAAAGVQHHVFGYVLQREGVGPRLNQISSFRNLNPEGNSKDRKQLKSSHLPEGKEMVCDSCH